MHSEMVDRFKQIQEDIARLKLEAKKILDERIDQLHGNGDLIKKIRVPKGYLKLWRHKTSRVQIPINWRYVLSSPFIYGMIFPAVVWHVAIEIYHNVCFRLYGIPLVNYREYFVYDRKLLSWLNVWEKINCIYCSYVNNLIRYSSEIGGRTERYWCPIKYYRRINNAHSQYQKFSDGGDIKKMRKQWEELRDFSDLK